jgi:PleD family two-component response regulator
MTQNPKGRILVVDDDENAVEILTRMLAREGHESLAASTGAEALATLAKENVDVILLDVMMPGMDGLEVCRQLRDDERLRQIPVILLTAKDDMETRTRAMALGVSEFLTKPVNRRELFMRIDAQLHARDLSRQLADTARKMGSSEGEPPAH